MEVNLKELNSKNGDNNMQYYLKNIEKIVKLDLQRSLQKASSPSNLSRYNRRKTIAS